MITSSAVVRVAIRLMRVLPAAPVRWLARRVGELASVLAFRRRAIVMENLTWLAPVLSAGDRRRATRRTFANMLSAAVDLWRLPSLRPGELDALVGVEGREHLEAAVAMGRGVIVVTAHLGPYELAGAWLAHQGYSVHAVVEELDPETSAALALYREATGMTLIPRSAGIRPLMRLLRDKHLVILVADRVVGQGTDALEVSFGRGRRAISTGPAALALATGAPIIVGVITTARTTPPQYLVHVNRAIVVTGTGAHRPDRDTITQRIGEELSAAAQAYPDQWFVFQPHWIRPSDASRSQGP